MEKDKARNFKLLVNVPDAYEQLCMYADYRIEKLMKDFLSVQTIEEVRALQKAIEELKRLKTLRDEVNKAGE